MLNNPNFPHFSGNQGQVIPPGHSRDSHNHMKSNLYAQSINLHPNENFSPPQNESFASSSYSQSGRAKKKIFEPLEPPNQINLSYRSEINHQPSLSLHSTRSTPQNNAQNPFPDNFQNTQPLSSKLPQPSPRTHSHNLSNPNYYNARPEPQQNYANQNSYMNQNNLHPQMIHENRSHTPTRSPIRNKHVPQDLNINVPPSPNSQFQNPNHLPPSPHSQYNNNNLNYPQKSPRAQQSKNFIPEQDFHSTRPQPQPQPQPHPYNPENNYYNPINNANTVDFDGMSMISGTSSRRRTKPIVILNINVGNGQSDELKVFDGENPEEVVNNFCMKYNLPPHIQPVLIQNLTAQMNKFYEVRAQKMQQRMLNRTQPNILEEDQSLMTQANNLQSQRAHTETAVDYYNGGQPSGYGNGRKNSYVDMNEPPRSNRQHQQQQQITPRQGYNNNNAGGVVPPSERDRERKASRSPVNYQDNQYQRDPREPREPQQQQYREPPQQQQQQYREPKQQQQYREPQQQYREPQQKQQQQQYREYQNQKPVVKSFNQLDDFDNDDDDRSQASSTSRPSTGVFDKLYEQGMRNKERKESMRSDLQKQMNNKELKEHTFQPQINKGTRDVIPKRQSRIEDELWKDAEQRRERKEKAQLLKEKLEMEGFTGTPKINTGKRPTMPRATQSKSPVHSSSRVDENPLPYKKPERTKIPVVENKDSHKFVPTINKKSNAIVEKNRNNNNNTHQSLYEDGVRKHRSINNIDERPSLIDLKTNQELFKPKINKSNPYYQKAANKRDSTFIVEEIAVDQDQLDEAFATRSTRSISRPSFNNRESKSVGPITSSGKKSTTAKAMSKQNISKDNSFSNYDEKDMHENLHPSYMAPQGNSSNKKIKEEELSVGSFHSNKKSSIFVSEPERERLIEIFQALDENQDGIITVQDIDVSNLDPSVIEAISDVLFALEGVSMMTFDDFAKAVYDMKVIVALREIYGLPAENPNQSRMVFSPEKGILKTANHDYAKDELSDYLFAEKDTAAESRDPRASEIDSRDHRGTSRSPNRRAQKSVVFADSDSDSKGLTKRYQALVDKSFSGKK